MVLPETPHTADMHWFKYHGEIVAPFYHMYNLTHINERMIELAVATRWLENKKPSRGVEVGNVTGHYSRRTHRVIDLHEQAAWYQVGHQHIDAFDILSLPPISRQFEWVLSLSTIEHTEDPVAAVDVLMGLVGPGGSLLVSYPTGVSEILDDLTLTGWGQVPTRFCTISREVNDHGGWAADPTPRLTPYGPWANTVAFFEWEAPR